MKKPSIILIIMLSITIAGVARAEATADTPQALYLKAGKEERQGESAKARQTYESIIDRFPDSEFAVKANDRLLAISPLSPTPPATAPVEAVTAAPVQTPPQPAAAAPASPAITLPPFLAPETPAPLPDDPTKRQGVELARLYNKARSIYDSEFSRREFAFTTQYGHRYNHMERSRKEKEWRAAADDKVRKELGLSVEEIRLKLQQACDAAGITGTCDEKAFRR